MRSHPFLMLLFLAPPPRPAQRLLHRLFDGLMALLLVLVTLPLLLALACAIRPGSPGNEHP